MTGDRDLMLFAVALMTSRNEPQTEIAKVLGLTQPEVSRLLTAAKTKQRLKHEVVWPDDPEFKASVEAMAYHKDKRKVLNTSLDEHAKKRGGAIARIDVLYADPKRPHAHFGLHAARALGRLFGRAKTAAIAWGNTIGAIVEGIESGPIDPQPDLRLFPISGEALKYRNVGASPSSAAKRLAEKLACKQRPLSLEGIAARIPGDMAVSDDIIRHFFMWSDDYKAIFSDGVIKEHPGSKNDDGAAAEAQRGPWIEKVDMIVTGIGDAKSSEHDPFFLETQEAEGSKVDLKQLAVGNLGGVWLAPDDAPKDVSDQVDAINRRSLGIQEEHLRSCATRARTSGAPGVVVVALGASKAAIVKRAAGMINHLIIDRELADAIIGKQT